MKLPRLPSPPSHPDNDYLRGVRDGRYVKAAKCDEMPSILPCKNKFTEVSDWQKLKEFEELEEGAGNHVWLCFWDSLKRAMLRMVGTLQGSTARVVVITCPYKKLRELPLNALLPVTFVALPVCRDFGGRRIPMQPNCSRMTTNTHVGSGAGFQLCELEALTNQCGVPGYAPFLTINDLREIDFSWSLRHIDPNDLEELWTWAEQEYWVEFGYDKGGEANKGEASPDCEGETLVKRRVIGKPTVVCPD